MHCTIILLPLPSLALSDLPAVLLRDETRTDMVFNCLNAQTTKARASTLHLPHGPVQLPIFMPVATQASLKGLTAEQLAQTGCNLCLNNTYHLGLKPGQEVLDKVGGAHRFQGWNKNILTDSGG